MPAKYPSWEPEYRNWYYRSLDKSLINSKRKQWYKSNAARMALKLKQRYVSDPVFREKAKLNARRYAAENYDRVMKAKAEYRAIKREELNAKQLTRYYKDHEEQKQKNAQRRIRDREKLRAQSRHRSATISDVYVREQLSKYSPVASREWPVEIVEAKKQQIRIKRELKRNASNQTNTVHRQCGGSSEPTS